MIMRPNAWRCFLIVRYLCRKWIEQVLKLLEMVYTFSQRVHNPFDTQIKNKSTLATFFQENLTMDKLKPLTRQLCAYLVI